MVVTSDGDGGDVYVDGGDSNGTDADGEWW